MDPLSALLSSDDGSSGLFDVPPTPPPTSSSPKPTIAVLDPSPALHTFDASKLKVKSSKQGSSKSKKDKGPDGAGERGGFGTDVFSSSTSSHVGEVGVDLFGGSAPLYGEGNIPGDLFDGRGEKEGGGGDEVEDIKNSKAFVKRSSLDVERPDDEIGDLKFAKSLLTREDDSSSSGLFGASAVKQVLSSDGTTVGVSVSGTVTSTASLDVDEIVSGVEVLGVLKGEEEGRGGRAMEDLLKDVLMEGGEGGGGEEEDKGGIKDEEGFDFAKYIQSQETGGGEGGGLFG
ncbi:hypothetical protein TrCOL_g7701 [Triparma columacea]|uniref:Uncharacterized protein n=1 Tax=Triparma columacea TaxID=722753 RepID=A0A9W7FW97_9STRA|nr:hypothetical protein TrCOL_g7701 [Triparma columacea]